MVPMHCWLLTVLPRIASKCNMKYGHSQDNIQTVDLHYGNLIQAVPVCGTLRDPQLEVVWQWAPFLHGDYTTPDQGDKA